MRIEFELGDFDRDMDEVIKLCSTWWNDSLFYKETKSPYDPNLEYLAGEYARKHSIGILGRDMDAGGKLACVYYGILMPFMFHKSWTYCAEQVWCVANEYRGSRAAYLLLKQIEEVLTSYNVHLWHLALPCEKQFEKVGLLLEKLNYKKIDTVYMRFRS